MAVSVNEWKERIENGIRYREKYGRSKDWERFWRYYRGDYGSKDQLPVNMIFAIGRSLIPRIYFRNPSVVVTPLRPGLYLQAKVLEHLDNVTIREIGVKKALKSAALDAFVCGTGIIKQGYDSEFGFDQSDAELVDGRLITTSGENRAGERIEYDWNIRSGWPWVKRINPETFVVPWGTQELSSAPWCAHMIIRNIDDVKSDPRYHNTKDLQATLTSALPGDESKNIYDIKDKAQYIKLWEIYDAKTAKVYVIAEGHDKFLREDADVLSVFGFPFRQLVFNPDDDHFWGTSDCINIEPLQLELNEIRTMSMKHRRLALLRVLYKEGAISDEELLKFLTSDEPGIGIKVTGDLGNSVSLVQPHVPPDFLTLAQEVRQDIREISGFSRNQLGEFDRSTRRTATEAAIVEQAASIRVDERRDEMADALADIVRTVNYMIFSFWTQDHVANIVGPDGARYWVTFKGEDLRGEYAYRIDPDNALPVTAQTRRNDAIALAQMFRGDGTVNQYELKRRIFAQFEGYDPEVMLAAQPMMPAQGGPMNLADLQKALAAQMAQGGGQVA